LITNKKPRQNLTGLLRIVKINEAGNWASNAQNSNHW